MRGRAFLDPPLRQQGERAVPATKREGPLTPYKGCTPPHHVTPFRAPPDNSWPPSIGRRVVASLRREATSRHRLRGRADEPRPARSHAGEWPTAGPPDRSARSSLPGESGLPAWTDRWRLPRVLRNGGWITIVRDPRPFISISLMTAGTRLHPACRQETPFALRRPAAEPVHGRTQEPRSRSGPPVATNVTTRSLAKPILDRNSVAP
jgi:hypothetical protein